MSSHAQNPSDKFIWWIGWWTMSFHVISCHVMSFLLPWVFDTQSKIPWKISHITMENTTELWNITTFLLGGPHYFDWAMFNSYVALTKKVLWPRPYSRAVSTLSTCHQFRWRRRRPGSRPWGFGSFGEPGESWMTGWVLQICNGSWN